MKFKYYYILLGVLLMFSCKKEIVTNLETPTFDVSVANTTVKAGQPIVFQFTGTAHTISFYSGETLKQYAFRDGRIIDVSSAKDSLSFTSSVQTGTQANQLSVWASTDFNGDYSSVDKVKAATWTDITSKFTLGTTSAFVASKTVSISDLTVAGKPIYIAFKYVTNSQSTDPNVAGNNLARQWYIENFKIKSGITLNNTGGTTPISLYPVDQIHAGFTIVDNSPETNRAQSSVSSTRITLWGPEYRYPGLAKYDSTLAKWNKNDPMYIIGSPSYQPTAVWTPYVPFNPNATDNNPVSETWAISAPLDLTKVDLGPDYSTAIKAGPAAATLTTYPYTYPVAGTYQAVFVGFNGSIEETKPVIKEMTITVTP